MKIKFLAAGIAPDYYDIDGETITAFVGDQSDSYDLSVIGEGDELVDITPVSGITPIRSATRINGELEVVLAQRVGAGHWLESGWMDAANYDPDTVHVALNAERQFAGTAVAYTRQGAQEHG